MVNVGFELNERDLLILSAFVTPNTLREAADSLNMPYSSLAKSVNILVKAGLMMEQPILQNRRRLFQTLSYPGKTEQSPEYLFMWKDGMKPFHTIFIEVAKEAYGSLAIELRNAISVLWCRSWQMDTNPDSDAFGPDAMEIRSRLIQAINKTKKLVEVAEKLVQAGPIWGDNKNVHKLISTNYKFDLNVVHARKYIHNWVHGHPPLTMMETLASESDS